MDKGSFYALALSMLGDRLYVPGSAEALACEAHGQQVLAAALDDVRWSFATREVALVLDADGGAVLPDDCLRIQSLGLPRWRKVGRRVLADAGWWSGKAGERVALRYTSSLLAQSVCLPDDEPLFAEGCALLLAARLAPRLTGNFQLAERLEQRGREMLYRAKLKDAQQSDSNDQVPMSAEELLYGALS